MHVAAWHRQTPESKFTKFGEEISIGQTPNHAKFCDNPTRRSEISAIENLCSPKKWAKMHQNYLRPNKSPHHAKFHQVQ